MKVGQALGRCNALGLVMVGFAYFALAYFGLQLASINPSASPIWPATGLAIAAVLFCGYNAALPIIIGAFAANYLTSMSPLTSATIAMGNTLEAVATAYLVQLWAGGTRVFYSAVGVGRFALISGVTTTISATTGVTSLILAGQAQTDPALPVWLTWWLGDFAGAVVVTPVVFLWSLERMKMWDDDLLQKILIYLSAIAIGVIAFSPIFSQTPLRDPLGFLAVAPLFWAALRCGPRATATVAALLAGFAVWGTLMQSGPFARFTLNDSFLLLLMFLISVSLPSLALSADINARRDAQDQQALLLRELSHRTGNTLAVVNSMFRRSARHAKSVAELEQAFQGRLLNLAASHRLLSDSNWKSVPMAELMKAALEPYCSAEYERCEFSGKPIYLPAAIATSLTMVLHELATNAAKHGALKGQKGKLRVQWDHSDGQLLINWEEDIPQSEIRANSLGYGTPLIDATISSLSGSVERQRENGKLIIRLSLPLTSTNQRASIQER
jgi:two-component sensor histidine kinase/integral membrane sensor domain MASE1